MLGHFGFRVILGQVEWGIGSSIVGSFWVLDRIKSVSGRVSDHLVSGNFRFWVVSGQVGSDVRSSSVGSYQVEPGRISNYLVSDHFEF
jgi:hypothetical protein